jgi:hypothetical protein
LELEVPALDIMLIQVQQEILMLPEHVELLPQLVVEAVVL